MGWTALGCCVCWRRRLVWNARPARAVCCGCFVGRVSSALSGCLTPVLTSGVVAERACWCLAVECGFAFSGDGVVSPCVGVRAFDERTVLCLVQCCWPCAFDGHRCLVAVAVCLLLPRSGEVEFFSLYISPLLLSFESLVSHVVFPRNAFGGC